MACFVCCTSLVGDGPVNGDKYAYSIDKPNTFQISMGDVPCTAPGNFVYSCVCCPCASYYLRKKALDGDLSRNTCCMGYFPLCKDRCPCDMYGVQKHPEISLCCEVCCCAGCAVSATRMHVMDMYSLHSGNTCFEINPPPLVIFLYADAI